MQSTAPQCLRHLCLPTQLNPMGVCVCNDVPTQTLHCVLVPNGIAYTQALDCRSYDKPNAQRTSKICYTHTRAHNKTHIPHTHSCIRHGHILEEQCETLSMLSGARTLSFHAIKSPTNAETKERTNRASVCV